METETITERLWRRDCKDCTHAYYLPYKAETFLGKSLRRLLGIKKNFKESCPVCGSRKVATTGLVTRLRKKRESEK